MTVLQQRNPRNLTLEELQAEIAAETERMLTARPRRTRSRYVRLLQFELQLRQLEAARKERA